MAYKVEIDADKCIGCGACVAACEASFEMQGDKAIVKTPEVDDIGCCQEAADGCPVECIKVTEMN